MLVQGGQGLIDATPKGLASLASGPVDKNNILRQSSNSQLSGQRNPPKIYSYRPSKPAKQTEKVGEYVSKEARMQAAQAVKASHFQLGYSGGAQPIASSQSLDADALKQKWNPQQAVAKGDMARSNWTFGNKNNF